MKRTLFLLALVATSVSAQSLDSLYRKADRFRERYAIGMFYGFQELKAIDGTHSFWYATSTPEGREYRLINADQKVTKPAFDAVKLAEKLSSELKKDVNATKLSLRNLRFNAALDTMYFQMDETSFVCDLRTYALSRQKERPSRPGGGYWGNVYREDSKDKVLSPDRKTEAYISEGNLWVRDLKTRTAKQLSWDGSPYEYYSSQIYWSPDSKKIVCCRFRPAETRKLMLIESSPKDQLQPKREEVDYPKPGDALSVRRPVAFWVETGAVMPFDVPEVEKQFDLGSIRWMPDSETFTFEFNQRGHQRYFVYAGDLKNGKLRTIVKEEFPTFVYYNTLYRHWFEKTPEMLWISERSGWRHLYLIDTKTGDVKKQLTKGSWVVKSVVHVDETQRRIYFMGCGKDAGEDPYLEKLYALDIDKGKLQVLTPENGNHRITFSNDNSCFVDLYSRVDQAPKAVVRSAKDGSILLELQNPDLSPALKDGWRMPEVFSAKGRDGVTDIWGVIIRPSNFDPSRSYPVIEYIYAGPHDAHVPKDFSFVHRCSALSELGFITVMIDGMGTANRSKAFHDVCWKNLKDAGFPDRIAWMKAAAANYPEMDLTRVGIFGGSAGGQSSTGALLFHPEFYKVGVSSCGCHDNRMDKIWWNEQWMGYPVDSSYIKSSNVENAHLLQGKLMLILGELDDNVDPASTLQVVDALIRNNKDFEFVMLPGVRHTLGENYGEHKRRDFFVKHLLGLTPPEWSSR